MSIQSVGSDTGANPSRHTLWPTRTIRGLSVPFLLMVLATFLWGVTNVLQKVSLEHLGPFTVTAARCWLGALVLLPFALRNRKLRQTGETVRFGRSGAVAVAAFCIGLCLQQISAGLTTVTNMGFLVNCCAVLVPLVVWFTGGGMPTARVVLAALIVFVGASVLSGSSTQFAAGDLLCMGSAFAYAIWTIAVGYAVQANVAATRLTLMQLVFTAAVTTVAALMFEAAPVAHFTDFAPGLFYLGVFGTGVAFSLSAHAQRGLSVCAAAIIMNLESVFTAIGGHAVMGDVLSPATLGGGAMILGGCFFVQLRR